MTDRERRALAHLISTRRQQAGMSARELSRRVGIDGSKITLLERCKIAEPKVDTVRGIATALNIPLADLYSVINWLPEDALPSLGPYMRAKFEHLPAAAVAEAEQMMREIINKHGGGPETGEDE